MRRGRDADELSPDGCVESEHSTPMWHARRMTVILVDGALRVWPIACTVGLVNHPAAVAITDLGQAVEDGALRIETRTILHRILPHSLTAGQAAYLLLTALDLSEHRSVPDDHASIHDPYAVGERQWVLDIEYCWADDNGRSVWLPVETRHPRDRARADARLITAIGAYVCAADRRPWRMVVKTIREHMVSGRSQNVEAMRRAIAPVATLEALVVAVEQPHWVSVLQQWIDTWRAFLGRCDDRLVRLASALNRLSGDTQARRRFFRYGYIASVATIALGLGLVVVS